MPKRGGALDMKMGLYAVLAVVAVVVVVLVVKHLRDKEDFYANNFPFTEAAAQTSRKQCMIKCRNTNEEFQTLRNQYKEAKKKLNKTCKPQCDPSIITGGGEPSAPLPIAVLTTMGPDMDSYAGPSNDTSTEAFCNY
jgi:hypothetical protein